MTSRIGLRQNIARRGGHIEATCNLGVLYQDQGDLKKAQELYEEARLAMLLLWDWRAFFVVFTR